jgi:hypothetical protein
MSEAFPVFIGITGKRELSKDSKMATDFERTIRERLASVYNYLERELPNTPKILLTGAAMGADIIAAEEVLFPKYAPLTPPRRNWLVLAILPFAKRIFQQDFEPNEWTQFQRIVADPRTLEWQLPNLRTGEGGRPFQTEDLERRPGTNDFQKDIRRRHYEQVGIWIADHANVLLGVMPTQERTDRIGGTARVFACRRGGRPDRIAAQVIAASEELAPRRDLYRPPGGYVWLIDPAATPLLLDPPITVLPPVSDGAQGQQMYEAPGRLQNALPLESHGGPSASQQQLFVASRKLFKIAKDYADENRIESQQSSWEEIRRSCANSDSAQVLNRISNELKPYAPAEEYRRVVYWLISGFLLAVLTFEVFAKYMHNDPRALGLYLGVLLAIIALYYFAEWRELQPTAEDRRAVREALRVQSAWWRAGLKDRVDHIYLEGADEDLTCVRDATRNATTWALLKCAGDCAPNWKEIFAPGNWPNFSFSLLATQYPRDWVGNQLFYFRQRADQRKIKGELFDSMSWSLFATAAWLVLILLFWLLLLSRAHFGLEGMENLPLHETLRMWHPRTAAGITICCIGLASACWWLSGRLLTRTRVQRQRLIISIAMGVPAAVLLFAVTLITATIVDRQQSDANYLGSGAFYMLIVCFVPVVVFAPYWVMKLVPVEGIPSWLGRRLADGNQAHPLTTAFGLGATILLGFVLQAGAVLLAMNAGEKFGFEDVTKYMAIICIIFLPALGGAMRFLSEKLAIEAEALSYRDAYGWYAHAAELLLKFNPGQGDTAADERARDVIRRLGKLALRENEAWLKTRRQRPLSPVIGS